MNTSVQEILDRKGANVHRVRPEVTVLRAVEEMAERHIGAVLVSEGDSVVGILSERDVMTRVVLLGRDPAATLVEEVMTRAVVAIEPTTTHGAAMAIMSERRCRHLPVVHEGRVVGMVTIGDLVRHASREQEFEIRMLTDYIRGVER